MPEDKSQAVPTNIRIGTAPGPNASIWSPNPMLGNAPDQTYDTRVVVEVWDEGESIFYDSSASPQKLEKALSALRSIGQKDLVAVTPWSDEPVIATVTGQTFRGRVVVELWSVQTKVAVTGSDSTPSLVQRAINRLVQALEPPSKQ